MRDSIHNSLIAFRIGVAFSIDQKNYRIRIDTEQVAECFILQNPVDETIGYSPGFSGDDCFVTANRVCIGTHTFFCDDIITGTDESCFVTDSWPGHLSWRAAVQTGHNV